MQLVLDIDDRQEETILTIIQNLKKGLVKNYTIHKASPTEHIPAVSAQEEVDIRASLETMSAEDRQIVSTSRYDIHL